MFCQKRHNCELLPPITDGVVQHVRRVCYQVFSWRQGLTAMLELPLPIRNGWEMVEELLTPCFLTKDKASTSPLELTTCGCKKLACQSSLAAIYMQFCLTLVMNRTMILKLKVTEVRENLNLRIAMVFYYLNVTEVRKQVYWNFSPSL